MMASHCSQLCVLPLTQFSCLSMIFLAYTLYYATAVSSTNIFNTEAKAYPVRTNLWEPSWIPDGVTKSYEIYYPTLSIANSICSGSHETCGEGFGFSWRTEYENPNTSQFRNVTQSAAQYIASNAAKIDCIQDHREIPVTRYSKIKLQYSASIPSNSVVQGKEPETDEDFDQEDFEINDALVSKSERDALIRSSLIRRAGSSGVKPPKSGASPAGKQSRGSGSQGKSTKAAPQDQPKKHLQSVHGQKLNPAIRERPKNSIARAKSASPNRIRQPTSISQISKSQTPSLDRSRSLSPPRSKLNSLNPGRSPSPQRKSPGSMYRDQGEKNPNANPPKGAGRNNTPLVSAGIVGMGPGRVYAATTGRSEGRDISPNSIRHLQVTHRQQATAAARISQAPGSVLGYAKGTAVKLTVNPHLPNGYGFIQDYAMGHADLTHVPPGESVETWVQGFPRGTSTTGYAGLHGPGTIEVKATSNPRY